MLTDAFVKGELSQAEFDARTKLCLAATTVADIAHLTGDLLVQPRPAAVSSTDQKVATRSGAIPLSRIIGLEGVLMFVAYALGVDLESELRAWYVIAFEVWAVGNLTGVAGALLLRPAEHSPKQ